MIKKESRNTLRLKRHRRLMKTIRGNTERPRLCIFRSLKHYYTQVINDEEGKTIIGLGTLSKLFKEKFKTSGSTKENAKNLGQLVAEECKKKNIGKVVFDRSGYKYHGRVKEFADAVRAGGISF